MASPSNAPFITTRNVPPMPPVMSTSRRTRRAATVSPVSGSRALSTTMGALSPGMRTTVRPARMPARMPATDSSSASTIVVGEPTGESSPPVPSPAWWSSLPPRGATCRPRAQSPSHSARLGVQERALRDGARARHDLHGVDGLVGERVLPGAADAQVTQRERRVVDGEERSLRAVRRRRVLDGGALDADAVVHPLGGADGVRVPRIRGELHARDEQQVGVARLRVVHVVERGVRVVVGDHHEIEAPRPGRRGDLVERGSGVAALARVHVEVARVEAPPRGQRARVRIGSALGLRGKRGLGRRPQGHAQLVHGGLGHDLRLAHHHAPRARGDGPRHIAARRAVHADDGGLGVAAAPAAEAGRVFHAPVEDVVRRQVVVRDLDLHDVRGHLEGHEEVRLVAVRHGAVQGEDHLGAGAERQREQEHQQRESGARHPAMVPQSGLSVGAATTLAPAASAKRWMATASVGSSGLSSSSSSR
jgi:hypothetical protein